ncbi:MAG: radical SAM protein [Candidatus Magasanikbacteria bacterium]|nr:radical SAM protein [Candidatus Magasanikbacteria bacterium]
MKIAQGLKEENPSIKLIFGGPQVPNIAENFLRKNFFIDIVVHGEGEEISRLLVDSDFDLKTPSISYIKENVFFRNQSRYKLKDLNIIPSPYLNGVFDNIISQNPNQRWIACWETNRGCPFSCSFCDWGSSTKSKILQFDLDRVYKEIEWFSKNKIDFVFCCDANFGILKRDLDIVDYVARIKSREGFPKSLSVQNTKNAIETTFKVQKILSDNGLNKGVTLSLQSTNPQVLSNIKRSNISVQAYQDMQLQFTRQKIETYTDVILGLPGETYESYIKGVDSIISNGQHNRIQFNNLSILPNSEMGSQEYQEKFGMVVVQTDIVNVHGTYRDDNHKILEKQLLCVGTDSMNKSDWIKSRVISWWIGLLYFNKILQIPVLTAHKLYTIPFRKIFELFTRELSLANHPILKSINNFFIAKALDIQNGGVEYCLSKNFLNIYWTADELVILQLIADNKINTFYNECSQLFLENLVVESAFLCNSIKLNAEILKKPFQKENGLISLEFDILEFYYSILAGGTKKLEKINCLYNINRQNEIWTTLNDYYKEVIWFGNKKGAYLYQNIERIN